MTSLAQQSSQIAEMQAWNAHTVSTHSLGTSSEAFRSSLFPLTQITFINWLYQEEERQEPSVIRQDAQSFKRWLS